MMATCSAGTETVCLLTKCAALGGGASAHADPFRTDE